MSREADIGGRVVSQLIGELADQEEAAVQLFAKVQALQNQADVTSREHAARVANLLQQINELKKPPPEEPPDAAVPAVVR